MSTIEIADRSQIEELMQEDGPAALIDFWAGWCGPCRTMAPRFEEVAEEMADEPVGFLKVDTEAHPDIAKAFNVRSLPTIVVVNNGEVQNAVIGLQDALTLQKIAKRAASRAKGEGLLNRLFSG